MKSFETSTRKEHATNWLPAPSGVFGLVLFVVLALTRGAKLLVDGDTYTHIRVGEWMLDMGRLYRADVYSHSATGAEWIAHEWGAEIIMALLHDFGGLAAVGIFYAFLAALSMTILYRLLEELRTPLLSALALMTATLLLSYPHIYARPHLFTWLFLSLTLLIHYRKDRWLFALPFLMLFWANLHGGFVIGLALQALLVLGDICDNRQTGWKNAFRSQKTELAVLALSIACSGINPYGVLIYKVFLEASAAEITRHNPEWWAPDFQKFWPFRFYLIILLFALLRTKQNFSWRNILLIVFFLEAALTNRRHISLAAMCLLPVWHTLLVSKKIDGQVDFQANLSGWTGPISMFLVATLFLGAAASDVEFFQKRYPFSRRCPDGALARITREWPAGTLFNEYSWGSCLIYEFNGKVPVFIDGFAEKYRGDVIDDYYKIAKVAPETEELLDKYSIEWILFPTDAPLTRFLLRTRSWSRTYQDNQASILQRVPRRHE